MAEGDVEFRALLFVPEKAPWGYYDSYHSFRAHVKLYVKQVVVTDHDAELLPGYLAWVVGVVDGDTLALSVSRDGLQHQTALHSIRKKLVCSSAHLPLVVKGDPLISGKSSFCS